ncbi:MAG TPA: hypothetical protein VK881_16445 [bacterium]|nr:hypothetical protein [bacterium]
MNRFDDLPPIRMPRCAHDQRGLTVVEILVASALMMIIAGAIAILMGAAVQSKMISAGWSSDTQSARITLAWMTDRIRQAGVNVFPTEAAPVNQAGYQARCHDRVVAQDSTMYPVTTASTANTNGLYITGEIPYTGGTNPGTNLRTIGYYLKTDAGTGNAVIMEYNEICSVGGTTSISGNSTRLSNPKISVTQLTFSYYDANGNQVTALTTPANIRMIQIIGISLKVQSTEGKYGKQTEVYLSRYVRLWDPEPSVNVSWVEPSCSGTAQQCGY